MRDEKPHLSASSLSDSQSTLAALPHTLTAQSVVHSLGTNASTGLSKEEAASRLGTYGKNALDEGPGVQPIKILINQIANAMMLVSKQRQRVIRVPC